jgi:hypothetical protein
MKKFFIFILAAMATGSLSAQLKVFEKSPAFSKAMETILLDFPNNYRNIKGELILAQGEFEHYASTVNFPGAESCIIGEYHSVRDTTASVQALMFRDESFEKAAKHYKALFKQLKSSPIKVVDGSKLYLDGDMEEPAEELDFTVSTLKFGTLDTRYDEFKIELEMLYKMPEWVININMITRKRDSDVRPDWMESGASR